MNKLNYHNLVFFDIASTTFGFNGDIVQIGAYDASTGDEFESHVEFDSTGADESALSDCGYDEAKWSRLGVPLHHALEDFAEFLKLHANLGRMSRNGNVYKIAALAGYNVYGFDKIVLERAYRREGIFFPGDYRMFDAYSLALWRYPNLESYTLESICGHIGLDSPAKGALAKARACFDVVAAIMGRSFKFQRVNWA